MVKKILVCGGDMRQAVAANIISDYGYDVGVYGFAQDVELRAAIKSFSVLNRAIELADIIVLPLPCSSDNKTINMPMTNKKLLISSLFEAVKESQIVIAGNVTQEIEEVAKLRNINISDYYNREELKILNSIPTVEGALKIAMEETSATIHGSKCMVTGFGRIGRLLAHSLKGLGAHVTVSARSHSDLAWIQTFGYASVKTECIGGLVSSQNIIFNTIPAIVLNRQVLERVLKDCLIIDLASKPGGVDLEAASSLGLKTIWALSLPGKVAPITAGRIIADTVLNLMIEMGV